MSCWKVCGKLKAILEKSAAEYTYEELMDVIAEHIHMPFKEDPEIYTKSPDLRCTKINIIGEDGEHYFSLEKCIRVDKPKLTPIRKMVRK